MRRRFSTRDLGLSLRMAFALACVAAIYVFGLGVFGWAAVSAALEGNVGASLGGVMFLVAIPLCLWKQYTGSAEATLRAVRARPEPAGDALVPVAERLAAQADVRAPDVLVVHSRAANALAVQTRGRPLLIVTTELLRRLTPEEVEAVLAHEVTHLANRDGEVMTFVAGPATLAAHFWHEDIRGKFVVAWCLWPFWLLGLILQGSISRYREFAADRGSGLLTGAPEQLMSALTKIAGVAPRGDLRGGAAVSALCIVETRHRWFRDHPKLEQRLARLAQMARELGRPVGP